MFSSLRIMIATKDIVYHFLNRA